MMVTNALAAVLLFKYNVKNIEKNFMKNLLVVVMLACPLVCCAMQQPKDLKRKAGEYLQEAKKTKQDPKNEAIVQVYQEKDVMELCGDFERTEKLESELDFEKKLMQKNQVALSSYDKKIFHVFDIDTVSVCSKYYAFLQKLRSSSQQPLWDSERQVETPSTIRLVGGLYTFEEGTSLEVIKLFIAFFTDPEKLSEIEKKIVQAPHQAFEMWHNAHRLGVEPLETFVGERILELLLRDKGVQNKLLQCMDSAGVVDAKKLKKVFVSCFGGNEQVFDTIFESYYQRNPRHWDTDHPIQEIKIQGGMKVHKTTMSPTGKFVTAEIRNECLYVYKHSNNAFELDTALPLSQLDKGPSVATVTFSSDDSLCALCQKCGFSQLLRIYRCEDWKILDVFEYDMRLEKSFEGFTKDNLLIFGDKNNVMLVLYDVGQKKPIRTCDRGIVDVLEDSLFADIKTEAIKKAQESVKKFILYENPKMFKLEKITFDGRYAEISFWSEFSRGSEIQQSSLLFDCREQKVACILFDDYPSLFLPSLLGVIRYVYSPQSIIPWRAEESKICFYGTTLQGIVEGFLGQDFFKPPQSTSLFSTSSLFPKK